MRYTNTGLSEFNGVKVGTIRMEQQGKRRRWVKCKAINENAEGIKYAHWQYVSAKTMKPTGKSTSFLTPIN